MTTDHRCFLMIIIGRIQMELYRCLEILRFFPAKRAALLEVSECLTRVQLDLNRHKCSDEVGAGEDGDA